MNNKLKEIIIIVVLLVTITIAICVVYIKTNTKSNIEENNEIIKYELKTSEYYTNNIGDNKYIIDSPEELKKFYSIYSNALNISTEYLDNNTIFIETKIANSSSISMKLSAISFKDNNIIFEIEKDIPEIGTDDMAFWYFVAIIPNSKLLNIDVSDWTKPSQILDSIYTTESIDLKNYIFEIDSIDKYEIITDSRLRTMLNDGGSNTNIYYQIDLENLIVLKIVEDYFANIGGQSETSISINYIKRIDTDFSLKIKNILEEIKLEKNEKEKTSYYTLKSLDYEENIYNLDTIDKIKKLLSEIDAK